MNHWYRYWVWVLVVSWLGVGIAFAGDPADELEEPLEFNYKTVTTEQGLVFRVPPDMPIEMKNGMQTPVPYDEYLAAKVSRMEKRLISIDERLAKIDASLAKLTEQKKTDEATTASASEAPPEVPKRRVTEGGLLISEQ